MDAARQVGGFYTAHVLDADPDGDPPWLATAYIPGLSSRRPLSATAHSRSLRWGCWPRAWPRDSRLCTPAGWCTVT
ncbi:hypothetical protein ACFQ60_46515 [Streptomyces zhihengii]